MELVDDGSLAEEIEEARHSTPEYADRNVTANNQYIRSIVERFIDLIDGLAYVHEQGFIHRDIKPQNILVSGPEKDLRLTDFGIAQVADREFAAGNHLVRWQAGAVSSGVYLVRASSANGAATHKAMYLK